MCHICVIVHLPEGHHTQLDSIIIDAISDVQKDKPEAPMRSDFNQQQLKIPGFRQIG